MIFLLERISKLTQELEELCYPKSISIPTYRMIKTNERFDPTKQLDFSSWEEFDCKQLWGGHREYYWFSTTVTIPNDFAGCCVVYDLMTGREGEWDATNPQFTVCINGELRQGFDVNHREIVLTDCAKGGETFEIVLSAFTGDQNFSLQLKSRLRVLDIQTEHYYYDVVVPYKVALLLDKEDKAYIEIITALNKSLNLLDLRKPYSQTYYQTLALAQQCLTTDFYENTCGETEATVYCVGHTHIDVAWLWTLAVTEDKAVRSFSTVLELMRRYPEYIFMSSQPQLYDYVKKNAPEIYEEIKKRVAEGRWEVNGGMWVEADCNIASGESLVRQFIHGQRFFKEEFNKDNNILWLPDVFGYSAALPQIMQKCGLPYFMTTKISWNEFNKMPYDTFQWEGIDGTKVLTHFISSRDYHTVVEPGSFKTDHFTTYNGYIHPSEIKGSWKRYQQKHLNDNTLMSFGFGDGGGGPTKDMLEQARRMEKGIPGCPKTKMATASDFFCSLEDQVKDNPYLPTWCGELYLEYHRGTYTSMSRNKKFNRKSEFAALNTELYSTINQQLNHKDYPQQKINDQWEVILRNQFHDILPGSSIKEVYDDSKVEYEALLAEVNKMTDVALQDLVNGMDASANSVIVFNPNGFAVCDAVTFTIPKGITSPCVYDAEVKLPCQVLQNGTAVFYAKDVPSKGYKAFTVCQEENKNTGMIISPTEIENQFYSIRLNEKGQFTSIFDKKAKRELLKPNSCANVLMSYEDKPHNYDAWDINNYYQEKSWEIDDVQSIEVVENGAVQATLKITRRYLDSTVIQLITVYQNQPRIDIQNQIDWKEKQILVKALFPVDIHTNEATFDIQYGNVIRPTHYNTSWDFARFEVCYHKWLDLSESNFGVSFLNDCKYGASVHDGVVGLSLLKSAIYPNPDADKEYQKFTFSIYPHEGGWREAKTVQEAYKLNNPLTAMIKQSDKGSLPSCYSLVHCDSNNIIIEVVKKAEDSNALILRMYECHNARTTATLTFYQPIKFICECDMMEENDAPLDPQATQCSLLFKPYEIKTLKVTL